MLKGTSSKLLQVTPIGKESDHNDHDHHQQCKSLTDARQLATVQLCRFSLPCHFQMGMNEKKEMAGKQAKSLAEFVRENLESSVWLRAVYLPITKISQRWNSWFGKNIMEDGNNLACYNQLIQPFTKGVISISLKYERRFHQADFG